MTTTVLVATLLFVLGASIAPLASGAVSCQSGTATLTPGSYCSSYSSVTYCAASVDASKVNQVANDLNYITPSVVNSSYGSTCSNYYGTVNVYGLLDEICSAFAWQCDPATCGVTSVPTTAAARVGTTAPSGTTSSQTSSSLMCCSDLKFYINHYCTGASTNNIKAGTTFPSAFGRTTCADVNCIGGATTTATTQATAATAATATTAAAATAATAADADSSSCQLISPSSARADQTTLFTVRGTTFTSSCTTIQLSFQDGNEIPTAATTLAAATSPKATTVAARASPDATTAWPSQPLRPASGTTATARTFIFHPPQPGEYAVQVQCSTPVQCPSTIYFATPSKPIILSFSSSMPSDEDTFTTDFADAVGTACKVTAAQIVDVTLTANRRRAGFTVSFSVVGASSSKTTSLLLDNLKTASKSATLNNALLAASLPSSDTITLPGQNPAKLPAGTPTPANTASSSHGFLPAMISICAAFVASFLF